MKTNQVVCNYAIVRFLPYPETSEFVNLGVVVACPSRRYFGFRLEMQKRDRVTGFFPELNAAVLTEGRKVFHRELANIREHLNATPDKQTEFPFSMEEFNRIFREVVKPRESLFRFSTPGTRLADSPEDALDHLYGYYVERMFARLPEYQEGAMARRLRKVLLAHRITGYRPGQIGNEMYEVPIPLLRRLSDDNHVFRAIKPLDLDKDRTTAITVHGDDWLARVNHLKEMDYDVSQILFAVHLPKEDGRKNQAAAEICRKLQDTGVAVTSDDSTEYIASFAKAS
ncbi:MAG: DUF3037 domain-containing protein [bacterium]